MLQVGQNIRRIREYKNLTHEWVAEKAGLSVSTYGSIERGDADVNFRKLADIAEALDVKEEDILTVGHNIYNNTFTTHDNSTGMNAGSQFYNIDKMVLEKLLKDKDEEIAFLRGLVGKG
jgi:transcriptional regulator with XRE-family HTH domain